MNASILLLWLVTAQMQPHSSAAEPVGRVHQNRNENPRPDRQHSVSITLSPVHLVFSTIELTGELRLANKLGLAAILGGGSSRGLVTLELGAQLRYYLLGSFIHGLQLGAEVLGTRVSGRGSAGFGLGLAPFVGYKISTNLGLTFEAQLGPSFNLIMSRGQMANGLLVLANLNVGWSF